MFCTTDFAENIVAQRKYELAEQHFHKIEILLFGAVLSIIEENDKGEMIMHHYSFMIPLTTGIILNYRIISSKTYLLLSE